MILKRRKLILATIQITTRINNPRLMQIMLLPVLTSQCPTFLVAGWIIQKVVINYKICHSTTLPGLKIHSVIHNTYQRYDKNGYVRHLSRNKNNLNMIYKYLVNNIFVIFRLKVWLSISSGMITRREKFVTDHVAAKKFCCYEIWSLKSCKMWKQRTHQIIL